MAYPVKDVSDDPVIRAGILELNNANARETSPLDPERLARMIVAARVATVVEPAIAFLLAFDQGADYDGVDFIWFRERFDSFLYVDRVIVAEAHRRSGLGRLLYEDLFRRAERLGYRRVTCEVNVQPPNPVSDAFHARLGFTEVGRASRSDRSVRYLLRSL
jgi:uncharacterized protein